jgi:hypothetical protein
MGELLRLGISRLGVETVLFSSVLFIRRYTLKRTIVKGDNKNTTEGQPKPADVSTEQDPEKGIESAATEERGESKGDSTTSKKEEH